MQYARFHIRASELRSALLSLRKLDFIGINLTVPHKIAAFAQIDKVDESATRCGAVNTIKINTANSAVATAQDDQKLIGFNTDGEGFLRAIRSEFSVDVRDLRVMIIGCVYGPLKTALLRAAERAGARGVNGISMLLHQGTLSFSIWFNRDAPVEVMRAALL